MATQKVPSERDSAKPTCVACSNGEEGKGSTKPVTISRTERQRRWKAVGIPLLRKVRHGVGGLDEFLERFKYRRTVEQPAEDVDFSFQCRTWDPFEEFLCGVARFRVVFGGLYRDGACDA